MTIRHLKIFLAVYKNDCNVTRAAESLSMSQPAVSLAIRELEEYYGVKLFERLGKRLQITQAGIMLSEYAVSISDLFESMEENVRDWEKGGRIRIGASLTIGTQLMPEYVKAFQVRYPSTDVRVKVEPQEYLEEKLLNSELDFALLEGAVQSPTLEAEPYMTDHLTVICSPDTGLRNRQMISMEEFRKMPLLLREKGSGTREAVDHVLTAAGYTPDPVWETFSSESLTCAVICGIGTAIIPYRMAAIPLRRKQVVEINVEGLEFTRYYSIVRHRKKHLTESAKNFIDLCRNYEMDYPTISFT
ncbi:MAG: LysR family transcriptional regulator [Solobacterium sp.]|nr:LysR family transcriptional regulator [Solobacterium sp.]